MNELLAFGISHKTAPLSVRERVALPEGHAAKLLRNLHAQPEIAEAVALSTCNRTELYVVAPDALEAESLVLGRLSRLSGIRPTDLFDSLYSLRNCDAARHLFRVACGLDSMILGESEVQGQVKRAFDTALGGGHDGAADQPAVPGGAGDRQAGADRDGDLRRRRLDPVAGRRRRAAPAR